MFDLILRVFIVTVAFLAFVAVLGLLWVKVHRFKAKPGEALRMAGGAFLCLAVSLGTLGVALGWDTAFRLPFAAVAVSWVLVGAVREYVVIRRRH